MTAVQTRADRRHTQAADPTLGGEREARLSTYLEHRAGEHGPYLLRALRALGETTTAAGDVLALPVLRGRLSGRGDGRAIAHEFHRFTSRRWLLNLSTVLRIPDDVKEYRLGSSKQTLRRKVRVAVEQGVTWHAVTERPERLRLLELANMHERLNEREEYRQEHPENDDLLDYDLWLVACAGDGSPLLLSVTPHDGEWASLRYFRTLTPSAEASVARYLMTEVLVGELSRRGVRYLIDAAVPHWLPNGLRHFQRMLGFRLVRLRLSDARGRGIRSS